MVIDVRDNGERCDCCEQRYSYVYWLPKKIWGQITPSDHPEGGLLCIPCADGRAEAQGLILRWTAEKL